MAQSDARLESAAQWFHYAEADMRAAKLLRDAKEHPAACFHAHQAVLGEPDSYKRPCTYFVLS